MKRLIMMTALMCYVNVPARAISDAELASMLAASAAAAASAASGVVATTPTK